MPDAVISTDTLSKRRSSKSNASKLAHVAEVEGSLMNINPEPYDRNGEQGNYHHTHFCTGTHQCPSLQLSKRQAVLATHASSPNGRSFAPNA